MNTEDNKDNSDDNCDIMLTSYPYSSIDLIGNNLLHFNLFLLH